MSSSLGGLRSCVAFWAWSGAATNTAFAGAWGVSFTANLTPDKETGLGEWTPEMFIATLRTGRHQGKGRPVLPPMPVKVYANATDDDLRAIFAYLQSLPPVSNRVPAAAAAKPTARPMSASTNPWPRTSRRTEAELAPNAMRRPISFDR